MAQNFFSSKQAVTQVASAGAGISFDLALVNNVILDMADIKDSLDIHHTLYPELNKDTDYVDKNTLKYGSIRYRLLGIGSEVNDADLPIAYPLSREDFALPVTDEIVKIYTILGLDYYERINIENSPNFNTDLRVFIAASKTTPENSQKGSKLENYQESQSSGITSQTDSTAGTVESIRRGFNGKYFKRNMKIHQLSLNEGDKLIQGRFGNSIRFSGYIHSDKTNGTAHPAILIRNGESSENQKKKVYDIVSEDINGDGTSIQITSGPYKTLYTSTINVKKEANDSYPSSDNLIGDQLVANSGRVILSSKTAETFLFSKKRFSIFTDDNVTIDSETGFKLISQRGDISLRAKGNKNIILEVNSGAKVYHGSPTANQQAILGNKLIDLISQLIDVMTNVQYLTYIGPSIAGGILPQYRTQLTTIKTQLKSTLSKNNYLI
jgi:hypothetical protein